MKIGLLLGALLLVGCGGVRPDAEPAAPSARPNLIIIVSDDQRWDALGYAGNTIIQTPNLDALAREGTFFLNAYATSDIRAALARLNLEHNFATVATKSSWPPRAERVVPGVYSPRRVHPTVHACVRGRAG